MTEPTRFDCYGVDCDDGEYIMYHDYAALREKAEAVVKEYDAYNFNKMVDRIAELKEQIK